MTLIYFKLGSVTEFSEETLDFHLGNTYPTAGILDYTNLNPNILQATNAGQIIQISEQDYWVIINGQGITNPPTVVNTGYLLTLANYLTTCPLDNDVFFTLHLGSWYKISWLKMKQCLSANGAGSIKFRVGSGLLVDGQVVPNDLDTIYQNDKLKNRDFNVRVNGIEIYEGALYSNAALTDVEYYIYDPVTGTINRPAKFKLDEIISIS